MVIRISGCFKSLIKSILEYEHLDPSVSYCIALKIQENGNEIASITKTFEGHTPPIVPMNWRVAHKKKAYKFLPYEDKNGDVIEDAEEYAKRIQLTALPYFPKEVLIEWFYRQPCVIEDYVFLNFETLRFERQIWSIEDLPGREAFRSETTCDHLCSAFEQRLSNGDWLAWYMNDYGTWNTPILLLENLAGSLRFPNGEILKQPYHLLEGHTRRSFLIALRSLGKALQEHDIWLVRKT